MKRLTTLLTAGLLSYAATAQTIMDVDTSSSTGITPGIGGIWDFNNTVLWSSDYGTNRVAWTNNNDIVRIQQDYAYNWGPIEMNVNNEYGQVGTAGIIVNGNLSNWNLCKFEGEAFELGAQGLQYLATNESSFLQINAPAVLTASQTWSSTCERNMDGGGNVLFNSMLLSKNGVTTDITISGMNISDPGKTDTSDYRTGFAIKSTNTFNGAVTVKDGAVLNLEFMEEGKYPLNTKKSLTLSGGYIRITSKGSLNAATQEFSNVIIAKGYNRFSGRNAGTPIFVCNDLTQQTGGTVDFPVSWAGAMAYTTTTNVNEILGGWATHNRSSFAYAGNDGSSTLINGFNSTTRYRPSDWSYNENVKAYAADSPLDKDIVINSLLIKTDESQDLATYTVTISSGGIIAGNQTLNTLKNGTIKSGLESGELFIHAYAPCLIDSVISDNGNTPCSLVIGGNDSITLTKPNSYSGTTYLNAGTLVITNEAFIANEVEQAGGTTLDIRNGGTIKPNNDDFGSITLNGNLTLEDGANLQFDLGPTSNDVIHLTNPYATFTGSTSSDAITLTLNKKGGISKQVYTLVDWDENAILTSLDINDFKIETPAGIIGTLSLTATSLDYEVTSSGVGTVFIIK